MATLSWTRPDEGAVSSKCGRFEIQPCYRHTVRPDGYWLHYVPVEGAPKRSLFPGRVACRTITEAKAYAERLLKKGEVA